MTPSLLLRDLATPQNFIIDQSLQNNDNLAQPSVAETPDRCNRTMTQMHGGHLLLSTQQTMRSLVNDISGNQLAQRRFTADVDRDKVRHIDQEYYRQERSRPSSIGSNVNVRSCEKQYKLLTEEIVAQPSRRASLQQTLIGTGLRGRLVSNKKTRKGPGSVKSSTGGPKYTHANRNQQHR